MRFLTYENNMWWIPDVLVLLKGAYLLPYLFIICINDLLTKFNVNDENMKCTNDLILIFCSDYAPRTVVLQRGPEGYGFILRGAKCKYWQTEGLSCILWVLAL